MTRRFIFFLILTLSIVSCRNSNSDKNISDDFEIPDSVLDDQPLELDKSVIDEMVQNIASPIETAAVIKGLKVPFNKDIIASTKFAEGFNTNFAKALGLGIYGCDLGYLNMYQKTSFVVDYITTIKSLADGIQVGQFFDFTTLKRLATNNENLDSLISISQQSMSRIDDYLKQNNRSNLSVVIVAGVWIEGLYLTTVVAEETQHKRMNETIGDQKEIINMLMLLLNNYKKDPNIANLISDFEEIKTLYNDVKITIEVGESEMIEKDGVLSFKQNDVQKIEMSDETLKAIIKKVQEIRNKLLKG
ncbi:MAG: hypothetical protein AB9846_04275 [Tenuifilaceae bacterium]